MATIIFTAFPDSNGVLFFIFFKLTFRIFPNSRSSKVSSYMLIGQSISFGTYIYIRISLYIYICIQGNNSNWLLRDQLDPTIRLVIVVVVVVIP